MESEWESDCGRIAESPDPAQSGRVLTHRAVRRNTAKAAKLFGKKRLASCCAESVGGRNAKG